MGGIGGIRWWVGRRWGVEEVVLWCEVVVVRVGVGGLIIVGLVVWEGFVLVGYKYCCEG